MKNMKKRSLRRIFAGILGIGILLTGAAPCAAAAYGYDEYGDPIVTATPVPDGQAAAVTPAHSSYYSQAADTDSIDGWPKGPGIEAQAAVLMDVNTEAVLYSKNADTQLYPASITKILTTLLACENLNAKTNITVSEKASTSVTAGDSSIYAAPGEKFTRDQALMAVMLQSANEMSVAVAEEVSGSVKKFAELMNWRAKLFGCKNTHFNNPNGLPDENQHTTAHDMALIFREAIKNQDFLDIIGTQSFTIDPTNMNPESRTYSTHHALVAQGAPEYYEGCFGGKTGVTEASKNTLVSGATRDGMTLIAVAMRADAGQVCQDHISMFDYGFNNFQKVEVSGGAVTIPKDVQVSDLTNTDNSYYYGTDYYVGSGSEEVQAEEPSVIAAEETTPTPEVTPESADSNTGQDEKRRYIAM